MIRTFLALLLTLPALPGCVNACTNGLVSALFITITSEATGSNVCNATVTATVGAETRSLTVIEQPAPGTCNYQDQPGGPVGTYKIVITAPGYQPAIVYANIEQDRCGADIVQNLTVVIKSA